MDYELSSLCSIFSLSRELKKKNQKTQFWTKQNYEHVN